MRSELVFRAQEKVGNKFLLCRATARTTRRLHFVSFNTTDAITDAFVKIASASIQSGRLEKIDSAATLLLHQSLIVMG